jgi:Tfp pilus assembly protein PilF
MWKALLAVMLALPGSNARAVPGPTPEAVLALPAELRARLHDEVIAGTHSRTRRFERLVAFMFEPRGLGMRYRAEPTPTVSEAYASRQANCLGFTLLFLALAHEADIEAHPREIRDTLSWEQKEGTIYRAAHVNAGVRLGGRQFVVDVAGPDIVAAHRPRRITERELMAHYYNNRAVEQLMQGDIEGAIAQSRHALELDPRNSAHWSNAGVLQLRRGDAAAAGRHYAKALALDSREAGALFNQVNLCRRLRDAGCETHYRNRLQRVQKGDPFHHYLLASDLARRGDFANAIAHYRRAIQRHGDEPRFHAALAQAYRDSGDTLRAQRAEARATALRARIEDENQRARAAVLGRD